MLEKILQASYDVFLETDNEELLSKKSEAVQNILSANELTERIVDDNIGNAVYEAEDYAFRVGFLACVDCFRALTGGEAK